MNFGLDKCKILDIERVKLIIGVTELGKMIRSIEIGETYKYVL